MRQQNRLLITAAILLLTLLATLWGRHTATFTPRADYLQELPLPFQGWSVTRQKLTDREFELLLPDAVLLRQYRSPDGTEAAELAVLAGHRKQTVHTPAFCMAGGGWHAITEREVHFMVDGVPITATQALMENQGASMLVTYFFTNGIHSHQSLVRFQIEQFFDRLQGRVPLGALVRVIVPITKNRAEAELLSDKFARSVLPGLLNQLKVVQQSQ